MSKYFPAVFDSLPTQKGRVICITGCTSGTGYVLAIAAALKGGEVVMLNRKSPRSSEALAKIKTKCPTAKVHSVACDLQDFESVRMAAAEVARKFPGGIDVLVNNAGIMAFPDQATKDGYDCQMQTNHTSHFLLTRLLFPSLESKARVTGEARVVNHSSGAAWFPATPLSKRHLGKNGGNLGGMSKGEQPFVGPEWERYHQTKLANMVFTMAMADKLAAAGSKVKALVAHPGYARTQLGASMAKAVRSPAPSTPKAASSSASSLGQPQTAEDGTLGILICALHPGVANGAYYGPKRATGPAVPLRPRSLCMGKADHAMLWKASCEAVGDFTIRPNAEGATSAARL